MHIDTGEWAATASLTEDSGAAFSVASSLEAAATGFGLISSSG